VLFLYHLFDGIADLFDVFLMKILQAPLIPRLRPTAG
jgi:hypothetical protein